MEYVLVDSGRHANAPATSPARYWPAAKVVDLPGCHPVDPGRAVRAGAHVAAAPWLAVLGPAVIVSERFLPAVLALRAEGVFLTADGGEDPVIICGREASPRPRRNAGPSAKPFAGGSRAWV